MSDSQIVELKQEFKNRESEFEKLRIARDKIISNLIELELKTLHIRKEEREQVFLDKNAAIQELIDRESIFQKVEKALASSVLDMRVFRIISSEIFFDFASSILLNNDQKRRINYFNFLSIQLFLELDESLTQSIKAFFTEFGKK